MCFEAWLCLHIQVQGVAQWLQKAKYRKKINRTEFENTVSFLIQTLGSVQRKSQYFWYEITDLYYALCIE
jgi:hypothetical protein